MHVGKIGIIDYGCGNFQSIVNMLLKLGISAHTIQNTSDISSCEIIILPGVGKFDTAVQKLTDTGWFSSLKNAKKAKIIGICLGMHLLFEGSEEGEGEGLGFIKGRITKFSSETKRVPQMGWKKLEISKGWGQINSSDSFYYFAHSFHAPIELSEKQVIARIKNPYSIPVIVQEANVIGIQFHPEKSHLEGGAILVECIKSLAK